jgi:hypothetical protein
MKQTYKEWIKEIWLETGGIINQKTASRISGLSPGTISRKIKKEQIEEFKYNTKDKKEPPMIKLKDALKFERKRKEKTKGKTKCQNQTQQQQLDAY